MKSRRKRAIWNSMRHLSYAGKWKYLNQHCTEIVAGTKMTFAEQFIMNQEIEIVHDAHKGETSINGETTSQWLRPEVFEEVLWRGTTYIITNTDRYLSEGSVAYRGKGITKQAFLELSKLKESDMQ